jgi:hypothetical protein
MSYGKQFQLPLFVVSNQVCLFCEKTSLDIVNTTSIITNFKLVLIQISLYPFIIKGAMIIRK